MLGTFSFRCSTCGHTEDRFVHRSERTYQLCTIKACGRRMTQVLLHAPALDWIRMAQGTSAGPEFIDRFNKNHRNRKAYEEKSYEEHGDYGPAAGAD